MGIPQLDSNLLSQFASSNYGLYNKTLARKLGLHESIFLGEIISEFDYWKSRDELDSNGYFYSTVENIEYATTLTGYQQRTIINKLQELGILHMKVSGMPAKRYFKINEERFFEILLRPNVLDEQDTQLLKNLTTSNKETSQLVVKKLDPNNNNNTNNINSNNTKAGEPSLPFLNLSSNLTKNSSSKDTGLDNTLENKDNKDTRVLEDKDNVRKKLKLSNKAQCEQMSYDVLKNDTLASYANEYLVDQQLWKSINSTQWKMRLENIIKYSNGSVDIAKQIIKQTWQRGYRDFYPLNGPQSYNNSRKPEYTNITREVIDNPKHVVSDNAEDVF